MAIITENDPEPNKGILLGKEILPSEKKKKKVKLVLFPASVILTLTFKLCKECHPKFSSIHTIALGSLSKSQPMLQQKTPQLNELLYCMSTENNKCPINPNSKHAKWKNQKNYSGFAN